MSHEWFLPEDCKQCEVYFGLFTEPEEGCQPRARALAIQQMTGSTADLAAIGRRLTGGH